MTVINSMGEFVDTSEPPKMKLTKRRFTTAEQREIALQKLIAAGFAGVCDICGKPFRRDGCRRNAKRCSYECKMEANRRRARERKRRMKAGQND